MVIAFGFHFSFILFHPQIINLQLFVTKCFVSSRFTFTRFILPFARTNRIRIFRSFHPLPKLVRVCALICNTTRIHECLSLVLCPLMSCCHLFIHVIAVPTPPYAPLFASLPSSFSLSLCALFLLFRCCVVFCVGSHLISWLTSHIDNYAK